MRRGKQADTKEQSAAKQYVAHGGARTGRGGSDVSEELEYLLAPARTKQAARARPELAATVQLPSPME